MNGLCFYIIIDLAYWNLINHAI